MAHHLTRMAMMESKYRVEKCIGRGNYGTVYLVRSIATKKQYVLKRITFENMPSKDRTHVAAEVDMLSRLNHPNIVTYKDHMEDENNLFIIMGYCEDGDLHTKIKEASKAGVHFSEEQILKWFVQMVMALKHVHKERILHRDLKTQNIFLTRDSKVIKLGDFGISKVLDGTLDMAKTVIGTPYYMSPELCENQPYGKASDVWSLGCILYELCVLKHAFDATNICGLIFKILNGSYPPIPDRYSPELRQLVARMLSRKPEDRPRLESIIEDDFIKPAIQQLQQDIKANTSTRQAAKRPATTMENRQQNETVPLERPMTTCSKDMVLKRKEAQRQAKAREHTAKLEAARKDAQRARLKAVNRERQQFLSTMDRQPIQEPAPEPATAEPAAPEPQPDELAPAEQIELETSSELGSSGEAAELEPADPITDLTLSLSQDRGLEGSAEHPDEDYESDFESYSDDFESDNDEQKVASELEKTANSPPQEEPPLTPAVSRLVSEPMPNATVNEKASSFRAECELKLGKEKLQKVYDILMKRWSGECVANEEIKALLAAVTDKSDEQHFMLVDQLIYCEQLGGGLKL